MRAFTKGLIPLTIAFCLGASDQVPGQAQPPRDGQAENWVVPMMSKRPSRPFPSRNG